jgi:hypothetical protein
MRRAECTLWVALMSCTPAVGSTRPTPLTAAAPSASEAETTTRTDADDELEWATHLASSTVSESGELLVATGSRSCTTKQCPAQCCNDCGRVVCKLASDPAAEVVAQRVKLPTVLATECSLHYDLRAEGDNTGTQFVVRAVKPLPSERGRRPGTPAQLQVRADGGSCTLAACEPTTRCCNLCSGISWVPVPTFDAIKWSGSVGLPEGGMDCDFFPRLVTGTWLGPDQFEIHSVRELQSESSR